MTNEAAAALAEKRRKNAERQRAFKKRRAQEGLVMVTLMVPANAVASLMQAAENMRRDGDLEIGPLKSARTGRIEKMR